MDEIMEIENREIKNESIFFKNIIYLPNLFYPLISCSYTF